MDRSKPRGCTLSLESCIRIRDLLLALLVWGMRLSKPDAVAIMNMGAISERNARYRLEKCPANVAEIFSELRQEVDSGAQSGVGRGG